MSLLLVLFSFWTMVIHAISQLTDLSFLLLIYAIVFNVTRQTRDDPSRYACLADCSTRLSVPVRGQNTQNYLSSDLQSCGEAFRGPVWRICRVGAFCAVCSGS